MSEFPFVSVIIPCRNEYKYIAGLIDSIIVQDYPKKKLEIIIADGMSDDGTRSIIKEYSKKYQYIKLIDNENKIVPTALNKAIKMSKGEIIIRLDAHSVYPNNYFSKLVEVSVATGADNVGAMWETCPGNNTLKAKAIALAMSHPFGVGNATYRTPTSKTEPFEVDTVPFGCYRRSVFNRIGYFDEELVRNQDNEFNERLLKNGGKIFLIPTLKIKYFARENFTKLWKMNYQYALFGALVDKKLGKRPRIRKYIPSLFVLSLILPWLGIWINKNTKRISYISFLSYLTVALFFSFKESIKRNNFLFGIYLFLAFCIAHISYGFGFIKGVINVFFNKKELIEISR